jgi:hypothetical protein
MLSPARADDEHLHAAKCFNRRVSAQDASVAEPGLNRHEWEAQMAALEEELGESPAESLPELDRLVAGMLEEAGIDDHDVIAEFDAARAITSASERDSDSISPGDVGAAINGYRAVYDHVIAHTES